MMNKDGSNIRLIGGDFETDTGYDPCFSPDGNKIVFTDMGEDPNTGQFSQEVFLINVDGTNRVQLTHDPSDDFAYCFTPDGNKIVVGSNRADVGNHDLYLMNLDGTGLTRLTDSPEDDLSGTVINP